MKSRRFSPMAVDVLEERMVMSAFSVPFALSTVPAKDVNPKFLVLTKNTENQINDGITAAFNRFSHSFNNNLNAYIKGISKPDADQSKVLDRFNTSVGKAFDRLSSDLLAISRKLPYGKVNLNPVLQNRVLGTDGVTDTTTNVNTPSLETKIESLLNDGDEDPIAGTIKATESLVRSDVKFYINQGVTTGYFKLGRGAILPKIS